MGAMVGPVGLLPNVVAGLAAGVPKLGAAVAGAPNVAVGAGEPNVGAGAAMPPLLAPAIFSCVRPYAAIPNMAPMAM